jgi:hypothetical protein
MYALPYIQSTRAAMFHLLLRQASGALSYSFAGPARRRGRASTISVDVSTEGAVVGGIAPGGAMLRRPDMARPR